jgi:Tfp pilus assembly protein PilN
MIEVNLLPGGRSQKRGTGPRVSVGWVLDVVRRTITDPWLAVALGGILLGGVTTGGMAVVQQRSASALAALVVQTRADSSRYAEVVTQIRSAEARRDSVLSQMSVIAAVDAERFVWPHVLDEVSRALPTYTWLRSIAPSGAANALSAEQIAAGELPVLGIRVIGVTVNLQALTQFMKQLEESPFLANVTLAVSAVAMVEGKEVTEFTLDLTYERPDGALLTTVPLPLTVR